MKDEWYVVCPVASWESGPLLKEDAEDLLEAEFAIHPFAGTCQDQHRLKKISR